MSGHFKFINKLGAGRGIMFQKQKAVKLPECETPMREPDPAPALSDAAERDDTLDVERRYSTQRSQASFQGEAHNLLLKRRMEFQYIPHWQRYAVLNLTMKGLEGFLSLGFDQIAGFARQTGFSRERLNYSRIEVLFEIGHQLLADAVSLMLEVQVAGVFAMAGAEQLQVFENSVTGTLQQRPDHQSVHNRMYCGKTLESAAAKEAEENCFSLIVLIMPDCDFLRAHSTGDAPEKIITLFARQLFQISFPGSRQLLDIDSLGYEGDFQIGRHPADKLLVVVPLGSAEAVIQVGCRERYAEFRSKAMKAKQKSRGIRSAGYCDDDMIAGREHLVFLDSSPDQSLEDKRPCCDIWNMHLFTSTTNRSLHQVEAAPRRLLPRK